METRKIVLYGHKALRTRAEEIEEFNEEVGDLIERMYRIMAEDRGLGLAGPQIGVSKRIFVYDVGEGPHAMINPVIELTGGETVGIEGCLSIPGLEGEVSRAERVTVSGINEEGKKVKIKAQDLLAKVFQHEIDHLDGTMFVDRADPATLETVPVDAEEQGEKL